MLCKVRVRVRVAVRGCFSAFLARGYKNYALPRARDTDLGQSPHLRRGVRGGSLRAPEPRAREQTRGRTTKKCRCAKKTRLYVYNNMYIYASDGTDEWHYARVSVHARERAPIEEGDVW